MTQLRDVSVKSMRHIIPLILMEVYRDKYGQYTKKCKGLWEKRPDDWPMDVPFVDPNNKLKIEGEKNCKPKKELLGPMLNYLIIRYKSSDYDRSQRQAMHEPMHEQMTDSFGQSCGMWENLSTFDLTNDSSALFDKPSSVVDVLISDISECENQFDPELFESQITYLQSQPDPDEPIAQSQQVIDNEFTNSEDWDPLSELVQRIQSKLQFMKKSEFASDVDLASMEDVYNKLKEEARNPTDLFLLIDKMHAHEKIIDIKKSAETSRDRCNQITGKLRKKYYETNENETMSEYLDPMTYTEQAMEVSVPGEHPSLMTSHGIKLHRRGLPSLGTPIKAKLPSMPEPMPEDTFASKPCTLSEYLKPVQLAEDDNHSSGEAYELLDGLEKNSSMPNFQPEDMMSVLKISDRHGSSTGFPKPVQKMGDTTTLVNSTDGETNTTCAVRNASFPSQSMNVSDEDMISGGTSTATPGIISHTPEFLQMLMQYGFTPTLVPAPSAMVDAQCQPLSNNLQPHKQQIHLAGKRNYPLEDDDSVEMQTTVTSMTNAENYNASMIPTMVEEMSDDWGEKPSSGFRKKSRRT